jgi:hypothetical protein
MVFYMKRCSSREIEKKGKRAQLCSKPFENVCSNNVNGIFSIASNTKEYTRMMNYNVQYAVVQPLFFTLLYYCTISHFQSFHSFNALSAIRTIRSERLHNLPCQQQSHLNTSRSASSLKLNPSSTVTKSTVKDKWDLSTEKKKELQYFKLLTQFRFQTTQRDLCIRSVKCTYIYSHNSSKRQSLFLRSTKFSKYQSIILRTEAFLVVSL